jgi:tetratricopeptide (TPR) repeat protein
LSKTVTRSAPGALLILAIIAPLARAQAPSTSSALAEQLFNQARDLAKANQWAEACPKFEASLRYDPVLGTRLNLATCYEHVGKLATAWGLYRESIEFAKKAGDAKRADYAQKQAAALEPRLPKLAISVPADPPSGFLVKRDDTAMDAGSLGVALYVDPGTHKIVASAPGFEDFTVTVTVAEGKTEALAIPNLVAEPATEPVVAAPALAVSEAPEVVVPPSRTRRYVGLGVGVAGVAAVGVGLVFGAKASSTYDDAKALCAPELVCSTSADYAQAKKLTSDARSRATTSTVLVIGGGAAIIAGAIVWFTARPTREHASGQARARLVPVTPVSYDGGAGLAVTGAF